MDDANRVINMTCRRGRTEVGQHRGFLKGLESVLDMARKRHLCVNVHAGGGIDRGLDRGVDRAKIQDAIEAPVRPRPCRWDWRQGSPCTAPPR